MRGCLRCFVSLFVATTDKLMASALLWSLQITVTLCVLGDGTQSQVLIKVNMYMCKYMQICLRPSAAKHLGMGACPLILSQQ